MKLRIFLIGLTVYMFLSGLFYFLNIEKKDGLVHLNWGIKNAQAYR